MANPGRELSDTEKTRECPRCGASPGERCTYPSGGTLPSWHAVRTQGPVSETALAEGEAFRLSMDISGAIYGDFCNRSRYEFGGVAYELADSEEGEPFTLIRKPDGAKFEVDLIAEVRRA